MLTMKPIATDRHSMPNGRSGATGSRIGRHLRARNGNTTVATADDKRKSGRFAPRNVALSAEGVRKLGWGASFERFTEFNEGMRARAGEYLHDTGASAPERVRNSASSLV